MAEQSEQQKQDIRQEKADVQFVMSDPRGRRFVNNLMEFSGPMRLSYTGNSQTFFNEGVRNVGLWLYGQIEHACPEMWDEMRREDRARKAERRKMKGQNHD